MNKIRFKNRIKFKNIILSSWRKSKEDKNSWQRFVIGKNKENIKAFYTEENGYPEYIIYFNGIIFYKLPYIFQKK